MVAPAADTRMSHLAYVVAAVNLGGVIVLLVMYVVEIPRGGPYIFGASSDLAGGIYNLLVVPLILHFGRSAAISGAGRIELWLVVVASVTGAISVAVALIQGAWLLWVCSRYLAISDVPRGLSRLGEFIGALFLSGAFLIAAGLLFPWLSWPQLTVFTVGAITASSAWIAWPFWYFRLGRYLDPRRGRPRGAASASVILAVGNGVTPDTSPR